MRLVALFAATVLALSSAAALAQTGARPVLPRVLKSPAEMPPPFIPGGLQFDRGIETDPVVARRDALAIAMKVAARQAPAAGVWVTAERALFAEVAAAGKYDLLVVPVQSDGYALDRISRSLLMAQLTAELRSRGMRVPNPYIVQRAFGEGLRTLQLADIIGLGERLSVARIVALAVSHDRNEKLNVSITIFDRQPTGFLALQPVQRLAPIALREDTHPFEAARTALPDVLRLLGVGAPARATAAKPIGAATVPESPAAALATSAAQPVALAASLQLMASLVPLSAPERARERLFEQALLAALALPDDQPNARLFRARAWHGLESRAAALRALGGSVQPEAAAYREYLNGNLPQLTAAVAKVNDPLARPLLEIDLVTLQSKYAVLDAGAPRPAVARFMQHYPAWAPLLAGRVADGDDWAEGSLAAPGQLLDRDLPVSGMSMTDQMRGLQVIGRTPDTPTLAKGMLEHLQRFRKEDRALHRCLDESVPCARNAYADLIEAVLLANLYRSVHRRGILQALYDDALAELRALKPEFDGQPDLLLAEAQVLLKKSRQAQAQQQGVDAAGLRSAAATVAWLEQGASRTALQALTILGVPSLDSMPFLEAYFFDLPVRSYWFLHGGDRILGSAPTKDELARMLRARADAAVTEINVVTELAQWANAGGADLQRGDVAKSRFHGHPGRMSALAAARGPLPGDDKFAQLESASRERPDLWSNYLQLGTDYIRERGDYETARKAFMRFPGFKEGSEYNGVALSNYAYEAGSLFFWRGHLDETRPLYRIAANLRTGSAASIASAARLALLDGDFRTAAELSLLRGQRYTDPYAFRDYLAWLFAFDFRHEAWAAFAQLHDKMPNPQVWLAADVGHRVDQHRWPAVKQWLLSEPYKASTFNRDRQALRLALMQSSVDRMPATDLVDTMRAIEGKPVAMTEPGGGAVSMPHPLADGLAIIQRSGFRANQRPPFAGTEAVESPFVLFAEAYVPLRHGNYAAAVEKFDRMATYYPIEGSPFGEVDAYALPYFSWAAARSGDKLGLEAFVRALNPTGQQAAFDIFLARAFFAGVKRDANEALSDLKRAFDSRPFTDKRPIPTEYQWTEACEWLFEATGDRRYIDLALAWAKVHQRIQPMIAWAYAFEAKYSNNEAERIRALGLALHLDPNAERIAGLPEPLKVQARQWLAQNNPFDPKRTPGGAI